MDGKDAILRISGDDESVKIINLLEEEKTSTITFAYSNGDDVASIAATTYLNAFVNVDGEDGPTQEEWDAFVEEKHIEIDDEATGDLATDGLVVSDYQTGDNKITFTGGGSIDITNGSPFAINVVGENTGTGEETVTPVISIDDEDGRLTVSNVSEIQMSNYDYSSQDENTQNLNNITINNDGSIQINSNAVFHYTKDGQDVTVSIDELRNSTAISSLTDRVITLERATAYQETNLFGFYDNETPSDTQVRDKYLKPNNDYQEIEKHTGKALPTD